MNVHKSVEEIDNSIKVLRIERGYDIAEAIGLNPNWEKFNLVAPQIAATINSIPGATTLATAGVLSAGAIYAAVMHKHYATKDIKKLKELRKFVSSLGTSECVCDEEVYESISEIEKSYKKLI